jgi:hypothetical protein
MLLPIRGVVRKKLGLNLVSEQTDKGRVFNLSREAEPRSLVRKQLDADQATMLLAEIKSAPVDVIESEERLFDRRWVCAGV